MRGKKPLPEKGVRGGNMILNFKDVSGYGEVLNIPVAALVICRGPGETRHGFSGDY
jgi:hypothetical protein